MDNAKSANYTSINNVQNIENNEDDTFERALRIIGLIFLISFFFPVFSDKKFYVLNIYLLNKGEASGGFIILLLLPAIYALLTFILPLYVKKKSLSITILSIALIPFIYLFAKTKTTNESFITSVNIFNGLWLLAISNAAMYIASKNILSASKNILAKVLGLTGGVAFLIYLFTPYKLPLTRFGRNVSDDAIILEAPFRLIDLDFVLTGLVMLAFYVLLTIVAVRLITMMLNKKTVSDNFSKINIKIFAAAWSVYLIGMLFASVGDIAINSSKYHSPKAEFYFATATIYLKSILYFLPLLILLIVSASKVFFDFSKEDVDSTQRIQGSYEH